MDNKIAFGREERRRRGRTISAREEDRDGRLEGEEVEAEVGGKKIRAEQRNETAE